MYVHRVKDEISFDVRFSTVENTLDIKACTRLKRNDFLPIVLQFEHFFYFFDLYLLPFFVIKFLDERSNHVKFF